MSETDTREPVHRIPVKTVPPDEDVRYDMDSSEGEVNAGSAPVETGEESVAGELNAEVRAGAGDDNGSADEPEIISIGDDDDGDEVIVEVDPDPSSSADTVPRARLLEMGRNMMRLEGEIRKLQTELYEARAAATKAGGRVEDAEASVAEAQESARRTQAEFQNFKRRIEREKADALKFKNADLLEELLPVLDNLTLAMAATPGDSDADIRQGVELIRKQLVEATSRHGLEPITCVGQPFDPNFHEGVSRVVSDEVEPEHVLLEVRAGYMYKDRLLRPAMVQVAMRADGAIDEPASHQEDDDEVDASTSAVDSPQPVRDVRATSHDAESKDDVPAEVGVSESDGDVADKPVAED